MQGVKSTSIVYHDLDAIRKEPYACFCQEDENNCHLELYPRVNGTSITMLIIKLIFTDCWIYICIDYFDVYQFCIDSYINEWMTVTMV